MSSCFLALILLCSYQTWLRYNESKTFEDLNNRLVRNQDKKYLIEPLQFNPVVIDSLNKLNKEKLFVLRFMRNDCHECIDSIFSNISKLSSKVGKENIVVLVDELNINDFYKYKRLYQEKVVNFFYFPYEISPVDKEGVSYYSIVSKKHKMASFVFLTRPLDFPTSTKQYLQGITVFF